MSEKQKTSEAEKPSGPVAIPPTIASNVPAQSSVKPIAIEFVETVKPVSRVIRTIQTANRVAETKTLDVPANPKDFEPAIDALCGLLSGTGSRFTKFYAGQILDDDGLAEQYAKQAEMSKASRDTIRVSGARLAAKRIKNVEALDWIAVAAAGADYALTIGMLIHDLRKIAAQAQAMKRNGNQAQNG